MSSKCRPCRNRLEWRDAALSDATPVVTPDAPARRHAVGRRFAVLSLLATALGMTSLAYASGGPTGGQIVGGSGQIQQIGNTTTIRQNSPTLSLNWQSFNIAPDQTVNFLQPGSNAIAINRIFSSTPSEIYGHLNANGQVWLINPNGVLFGQSAQVNVGGLVASTLDFDDSTLASDNRRFSGSGKGSIINRGSLTASNGGYIALLGNQVSNQGVVTAQLGTVAMGGGSAVTLTFSGNQVVHLQVDQSTLNNLVENRQLIVADGGRVIMTAGAKDSLLASVVNNTGAVQAQSVQNHDGTITLLGGMEAGTVNVGGTLDASAPNGGNGGSIETSAANFNLSSGAHITAAAPHGQAGTWLVDPTDLTIDSAAATTISSTLNGGTSVTEQTTSSGASGVGTQSAGAGDINVNAAVSWNNSNATLTLLAYHGINVNAPINGGNTGKVVMDASGANLTIASGASIAAGGGVTLATGANFVNNAGSAAVSAGSANWLIYSTNPTLDTTGGLTPNFIQYNAPYQTAAAASGNGFLYSVAPTLTVSGLTGSVTKTYDGTTSAALAAANLTTSGLLTGDKIASATGTYASPDAGSGIAVTSPSSISGFSITNAANIPIYGYGLSGSATASIGTINQALLTASIIGNPTKVYDGTTTATLSSSNYQINGFVTGQGATVNQPSSVAYANASAGSTAVNATFTITNFVANSGTNLSNYSLPTSATGTGTITPAPLLLSGLLANSKVYDGSTADALNLSNVSLYGVISSDNGLVTLGTSGATGNFASANAGNGITVNVGGFTLGGTKASDYQIVFPTDLTANITPKNLTVSGAAASNKVYDGTNVDTLSTGSATLNGVVGSDNVTLAGSASGHFSQSDVGNNLAVSVSGLSLTGTAAGNYTLTQPTGLTANITPQPLTVSFNGSPAKIYDGSTAATLTSGDFSINGFVSGQSAVVSQSPAVYASSNAGTNIGVTATLQPSDFTPGSGTSLSNYSFNSTVTGTGTINPAPLVVSIVNNPTKVFDGTTGATLDAGNYTLSGLINGESITFNGPTAGAYDSANAGIEGVSATLSGANFAAGSGTLLSNYLLPTLASGFGTITPKAIGVSIIAAISGNPTKVYDGTTAITLLPSNFTLTGFVNGDSAVVNKNIAGTFASKNVSSQPLTATLQEVDFNFTGSDESNYTFPVTAFGTGTITPAPLTVSIIGNPTKVYDGSTVAQLTSSNFQINGFVSGEGASLTPTTSFNYATANAGSNINITGTLTANNYTANSGTLLSNYTLATTASGLGAITQAPLFVTGVFASNKVYDTTTSDTLSVAAAGLAGLVASDVGNVTLTTSTSGTFAQANVGNGIGVTASGFSISGSAATNYILQPIAGLAANITPKGLTISGVTATDKVYDGTTADTLNAGSATLNGVLGSDNVTFSSSGAGGQFSTANVGNNLDVTTSGFTLGGAQAGNYTLTQPGGLTANITPRPLTATITGSPTKVYDGTNSATLTASDYTLTGFVTGQGASIPQSATANYTTPNAGTGLGVQSTLVVSDFVANAGTNLSNYILPATASGNNGVITPYVLNLTGTRVYDANTDAAASLFGSSGVLTGLNGDQLTVSGTGTLSTKNVGKQQPFASGGINSFTLTGNGSALASNYTLVGGTDWVTITPAILTVSGTVAANKVYDNNTAATLSGSVLNGKFAGDNVALGNDTSGTFATKNVGNGIAVSTSMTVSGSDAGNYIIQQPTGIKANITPLAITVTATGTNRQYDGTVNDAVTLAGTLVGDSVTINDSSATFADPNVANGKTVTVNGITLSGASAGNYTLSNTSTTTTANITPKILNLTGTRVYDANTAANAGQFGGVSTGVGSEVLNLGGSGTVSSKNVGTYTGANFSLNTLTLSNNTGLASNYTLVGGTDTFTITPATLTVSGTVAANKIYDGTTAASLSGSTLNGVFSGDNVTLGNDTAGTFATKNVGNGIAVGTSMTVGGSDAGNYILTQPSGITANITPLAITVTATGTNRVYNGTVNDAVTLAGTLVGDSVTINDSSATFVDPNVANGKTVTVNGITLSGASAGNYTLNNTSTTTTANVTPVILNLTGTRVYDTTTNASASLFGSNGVLTGVNGETLTLSGSGAVSSQNVGSYTGANFGLNTLTLTGNGSALASNYTLAGGIDTLTITPYVLNLSGTRVYNATTGASASLFGSNGVLTGVNGETVNLGGSGVLSSKNVGAEGFANLGTLALSNGSGLAGNYTLAGGTDSVTVTPYVLNLTSTRAYDGTTGAAASLFGTNGTLTGVSGETVKLSGSGVLTTQNVGTQQAFANLGTLALANGTGLAGNYTLAGGTDWVTITPYVLNLTGTRVYDANTDANANLFGSNGVLTGANGETLTLSGSGAVSSKNVGSYTGANFNPNTLTLTGNGSALASNYTLTGGTDTLTITQATLTVSGTVAANKIYDGTTAASLSGSTLNGVFAGDNVALGNDSTGTFASKDAGNNIAVGTGMTIGGTAAGNYIVQQPTGVTANITPYVLNLTGTRVYDANTDANASLFGSNGVLSTGINGETVDLSGSGAVSSKNVGSYTGANFALNTLALSNGTGLAGNYTLVGGTDSVTITKAPLTVTGTVAASKTYDGNDTAQLSGSTLSGLLGSDDVTLGNDSTGTFASKNVGNNIAVSTGMTISGADVGNYAFTLPTGITANITPVILSLTSTRVYDATTNAVASLFGTNGVLTGVNGETLTLGGTGTLSTKNVGTQQAFAANGLSGFTLTGNGSALAGNYTLAGGTDWVTITPATLTVIDTVAGNKVYDGNTTAQLSGSQLQGVFGGDTVTLGNDSTGTFASPNAGNGIGVGTAMTVGGGDAGNYVLVQPVGITANITPHVLSLTGTRVYDANTDAAASLFGSHGVLTGVNGETLTLGGNGTLSTKNVGTQQAFAANGLSGFTLSGNGAALASNYTLTGGTDWVTITPATLTITGTTVQTRQYDGTTAAQLSGSQLQGVLGGDNITLGNTSTGTFASPNAGTGIGVSTNMTVGGTDASNYVFAQPSGLTGTITPHVLDLIGTRVYDGHTDANAGLFGSSSVLAGVNGETVDLSGSGVLNSKHVGTQGFANLGTLALSNGSGLASNYTLTGGTDQVTITPLNISVAATGQNKTYDGNTTAGVTLGSNSVLAGDVVNFSDGAANFSTPNAGSNVSIAVTGISASGADAGDYAFNGTATTSATINPYVLSLTSTRVYNGTTGANANLFGNNGVLTGVNGETVNLSGSGVLTSKNVGSQRAFANTGSLVLGNGTGLAGNYTLAGGTDWVSITPATLAVIDTTTTNRVYDGTNVDALSGSTLSGVFGNDNVVLGNDTTGLFGNKNVGNGKAVSTAMTISGGDASNYILVQPTGLTADVTPLPIMVTATGTNRMYNGRTGDVITLSTNGVLTGDQLSLTDSSANFADPYVGNNKTVTVSGIAALGADAANYLIVDPVTTTTANITSAGFDGSGVQGSWIAQLQAGLEPAAIATPYGSTDSDTVGVYTGNHQLKHRPIERNRARSDFRTGLSLQFQNGGVRLPSDASP